MKKQKYILEKAYQDYKYAFAEWSAAATKLKIKDRFYDLNDKHKRVEWLKKFYNKKTKKWDKVDKAEKKFLDMVKPGLFKSYTDFIAEKTK